MQEASGRNPDLSGDMKSGNPIFLEFQSRLDDVLRLSLRLLVSSDFFQTPPVTSNSLVGPAVQHIPLRMAIAVTAHGISDVLSVFGSSNGTEVGAARTFSADVVLADNFNIGIASITAADSDFRSVIRSTNKKFPGQIKEGNILSFTGNSSQDPIFVSVVSVATSSITVTGVTTVRGVASGAMPASITTLTDLKVIGGDLGVTDDSTLYTEMPRKNISNVTLNDASLTIRKTQQVNIVDNKLSAAVTSETNESFLPFTPERYTLIRSDGTTEELTSDKVQINSASNQLEIFNLGLDNEEATLVTTLTKIKPKAKNKIKNRY